MTTKTAENTVDIHEDADDSEASVWVTGSLNRQSDTNTRLV